ncbi:MAG: hypothetical protein FWE38_01875 [Firmicutes bacterium]|nr:hypothetical protein [Bacillota bacterium]
MKNLDGWASPDDLPLANFNIERAAPVSSSRPPIKPEQPSSPPPPREPEAKEPPFDIMSILPSVLPLLSGEGDMLSMLAPLLKGKSIGGMDVATILPLVGPLLTKKQDKPPAPAEKIINLNEYRRID